METSIAGVAFAALLSVCGTGVSIAKEFHGWYVGCTSGLTCSMSFANWGAMGIRDVAFRRSAAPNAEIEMLLLTSTNVDVLSDPKSVITFRIDGKGVLDVAGSSLRKGDRGYLIYSEQTSIKSLIEAMKAGTGMDLVYAGTSGQFKLPVKLQGVRESLLHIDTEQDRLQRTDAWEAKGGKPPREPFAAKDIRRIADLPEGIRRDFIDAHGFCSSFSAKANFHNAFETSFDNRRWIVVPCGSGGAYNQPYALYVDYGDSVERLPFPDFRDGGPSARSTAYNVVFDPKTNTLTSYFKGRGVGGCGHWFKWTFARGGKPALVLLEQRSKPECGDTKDEPETFPREWPVSK